MRLLYEPFLVAYQLGPERRNHGTPNEHVYERYYNIVQQEMQTALENNHALFADTYWFDHEYCTFDSVKTELEGPCDPDVRVIVSKDHAYNLVGNYDKIPEGFQHVFMIRQPQKMFLSFKTAMTRMYKYGRSREQNAECGTSEVTLLSNFRYAEMYNLYKYIATNIQEKPLVIDADDLQNHPESILRQLFEGIGVPYQDSFTTWPTGGDIIKTWRVCKLNMHGDTRSDDGIFFSNAFESTRFEAAKAAPTRESLPQDVLEIADSVMPMYEELYQLRMKP